MDTSVETLTGVWTALIFGGLGFLFMVYFILKILRKNIGSSKVQEISELIHDGTIAFLKREYSAVFALMFFLGTIIFFFISIKTAFAFLMGAGCSMLMCFLGTQAATRANGRTAQAASMSFNEALQVAFHGGAVVGIGVVSIGLLGLSGVYLLLIQHAGLHYYTLIDKATEATQLMIGFGMETSLVSFILRVGSGVYTRAASDSINISNRLEMNVPENDPRNPAVIADKVGHNVCNVTGLSADLFESFIWVIISAMVIAMIELSPELKFRGILLVLLIAALSVISTVSGVLFVRAREEAFFKKAFNDGLIFSTVIMAAGMALLALWYGNFYVFLVLFSGVIAGALISFSFKFYTSGKVMKQVAADSKAGGAAVIISGLANGMYSTIIPLITIGATVVFSFRLYGFFGMALAALGMLSFTGIIVTVNVYDSIVDNAADIAEMAGMGTEVKNRIKTLNIIVNRTTALARGFTIGPAALTALVLLVAFTEAAGLNLFGIPSINIMKAEVMAGLFLGGMAPFMFSAATLKAIGKVTLFVIDEVKRQLKEISGLMEAKARPDLARCVNVITAAGLKEMMPLCLLVMGLPFVVGILMGGEPLGGFLAGSLITGLPLAIFSINSGVLWNNTKKYIAEGNLKSSIPDAEKTLTMADVVGNPLKDASGPALGVLLKLLAAVAFIFTPLIIKLNSIIFSLF